MRINTDGNQAYRKDLFERTAEQFDEETKTGGIEAACLHSQEDIEQKREVIEFLTQRLPPGELEQVAEMLSTQQVPVRVTIEAEVGKE